MRTITIEVQIDDAQTHPMPVGREVDFSSAGQVRVTLRQLRRGESFKFYGDNRQLYWVAKQLGVRIKAQKQDGFYRVWHAGRRISHRGTENTERNKMNAKESRKRAECIIPDYDDVVDRPNTPRTDAVANAGLSPDSYIARMTYLARALERENAALQAELESWKRCPAKGEPMATKLMNLPKEMRDWCIKNLAPQTFIRWSKQREKLADKIRRHMNGEPLSDLAIIEGSSQPKTESDRGPGIKGKFKSL